MSFCPILRGQSEITIDGAEATHNKRRPLFDGGSTFEIIMNNLKLIKKYDYFIYLRINVDEENKEEAFKVVDILEKMELTKWVIPYIALVRNHGNCYIDDRCMSDYEYLNIKKRFNNYIANKGFVYHFSRNSLPRRVNCVCTADKANDLVIDADGRLYKCWTDIGKQNLSVGDIKDGISKNPIYLRYVGMDPTMDLECRECKYLPICLSGCPANRHDKKEGTCLEISANLKSAVYSIVENYSIDLSNQ